MKCEYQQPKTAMTLREGLEEYRRVNPGLVEEAPDHPESSKFFRAHDLCHVVFGTNTNIAQEAMTDAWTIFGTDVGFKRYLEYIKLPEAQDVLAKIGYLSATWQSIKAAPLVWRVWRRSTRMRAKWPWFDNEAYYDKPLTEIRSQFGIEVLEVTDRGGVDMPMPAPGV